MLDEKEIDCVECSPSIVTISIPVSRLNQIKSQKVAKTNINVVLILPSFPSLSPSKKPCSPSKKRRLRTSLEIEQHQAEILVDEGSDWCGVSLYCQMAGKISAEDKSKSGSCDQ
jgi:hypothetical protein